MADAVSPHPPEGRPDPSSPDGAGATRDDAFGAGAGGVNSPASDTTEEGVDALDAAAQAVEVDLEALLAEREQFLDAYRRAQADFENYRKQAQKRQDDAAARELGGFVERLLPVLDATDAAANQGARATVEPIIAALYGALAKEGLERIDPKGEVFDPAIAEAVIHEPGEGGAQVVSEVMRTGYRWRGRLLRPALVKVTD